MALTIEVTNLQKTMTLKKEAIIRAARKVLKKEGVSKANLSLVFVSDRKIHSLNKKFLGHDYPTDVLAFDLSPLPATRYPLNAEIIISTDAACRQAKHFASTPQKELILYVVHGILHVLGYDDHRLKDAKRMRQRQEELMKALSP